MTTVTLDPTNAGQEWSSVPVTVTMSAFDAGCANPSIWYRLDGSGLTKYLGPFVIHKAGETTVEYQALDSSGNWEVPRAFLVRIGSTAPRVTHDAGATYLDSATIHLTATSGGSGIALFQARLDDEPTQTATADAITVSSAQPGDHVIHYYARDGLGHDVSGAIRFTIQTTPRSVAIAASVKQLMYPSIVELTATATNPETTTALFQARRVDRTVWEDLGTVSSSTGQFVFLDVPRFGYSYRAVVGSVESSAVLVTVRVPLGRPVASTTRIKVGRVLGLWGTIRPKHGPATAEIRYRLYWQRYDTRTRRWVNATPTSISIDPRNDINSDTSKWVFRLSTRKSLIGTWRVRFFHECPRHKASYSPWRTFSVVK